MKQHWPTQRIYLVIYAAVYIGFVITYAIISSTDQHSASVSWDGVGHFISLYFTTKSLIVFKTIIFTLLGSIITFLKSDKLGWAFSVLSGLLLFSVFFSISVNLSASSSLAPMLILVICLITIISLTFLLGKGLKKASLNIKKRFVAVESVND